MTQPGTLADSVAAEVRAQLARQRMSASALAKALGKSEMYISRRLRGEMPLDLDDLERIASALEVDFAALLPAVGRAA